MSTNLVTSETTSTAATIFNPQSLMQLQQFA